MPARSIKYPLSIIIAVLLIVTLLATVCVNATTGIVLTLIFLLFVLSATSFTIIQKNRNACQQGDISRSTSIKNTCLEISAVLFAMILAGLVGHFISTIVTGGINSTPAKLITGIAFGLLAGWTVGLFIKHASGRFVRTSSGR
jgi:hypothetical protein